MPNGNPSRARRQSQGIMDLRLSKPAKKGLSPFKSVIVVSSRLSDDQVLSFNPIDEPVLLIDSLRPPPRKLTFQWFWFSSTSERIPFGFLNQPQ
jgi:hypothetical protein